MSQRVDDVITALAAEEPDGLTVAGRAAQLFGMDDVEGAILLTLMSRMDRGSLPETFLRGIEFGRQLGRQEFVPLGFRHYNTTVFAKSPEAYDEAEGETSNL